MPNLRSSFLSIRLGPLSSILLLVVARRVIRPTSIIINKERPSIRDLSSAVLK